MGSPTAVLFGMLGLVVSAGQQRPVLPANIGSLHHAIRTTNAECQRLFDQGLTLFYGFNRTGARQSFLRAASLDPTAAMPHVGIALALGPNLNSDSTEADIKEGCAEARRGSALAREPNEKAYADALMTRYCAGLTFQHATNYAIDMGELFQRYPDDADAATLYADSLLALRPRSPEQNVELVAVLELVLGRWPRHVGANHYYIHAVEGSRTPERALVSAQRLETLVPVVGHLLHMPSHIYSRVGDYARAIQANERAAATDVAYMRANGADGEQLMYYEHDLESLAVAAGMVGRFAVAQRAGTAAMATPGGSHGAASPAMAATFSPILAFVHLRFSRWEDALRMPPPSNTEPPTPLWYHFTRAVAQARLGRGSLAATERDNFLRLARAIRPETIYRGNQATQVMDVLAAILDARLDAARADEPGALRAWERAVAAQDRLVYHEPPAIYYSVRESFGAALLRTGRLTEAEAVFRDDLTRHPRSGRSLFGLWQTLSALGRRREAEAAKRTFEEAWAGSDTILALADF
jgi:tetratricopeptide (TPR) repeat protein